MPTVYKSWWKMQVILLTVLQWQWDRWELLAHCPQCRVSWGQTVFELRWFRGWSESQLVPKWSQKVSFFGLFLLRCPKHWKLKKENSLQCEKIQVERRHRISNEPLFMIVIIYRETKPKHKHGVISTSLQNLDLGLYTKTNSEAKLQPNSCLKT